MNTDEKKQLYKLLIILGAVAVLLSVISIGILFAVRKFLFIHPETKEETARRREHFD